MASHSRIIKTYMSYGLPLDPAKIMTLVDLDISYALASTLTDWTESRHLKDGLTKLVDESTDKEVILKIRGDAKWSDGSKITADQIIKSFNRAKKDYANDLSSLFDTLDSILAMNESTFIFKLNKPIGRSQLMQKLTEPMYGVVFVKEDGSIDLTKSSGPYVLVRESKDEVELKQNAFWYGKENGMAEKVLIRPPQKQFSGSEDSFAGDSWSNIVSSSSLMSKELEEHYRKEHFARWNRNLDRIFFFVTNPKRHTNADGRNLLLALNEKLDRAKLLNGITGYELSNQFFGSGYAIYDHDFKGIKGSYSVPEKFKKKPLELLALHERLDDKLRQNISDAIESVTGLKPKFVMVSLKDIGRARNDDNYDIYLGTISVNDPNVEAAVSFFFNMNPALIPNSESPNGDFKSRTSVARNLSEAQRNSEYRKVFTQAVQDGCLLPLFHFSSIAIARDGIDLSKVPTTDETVAFSKVRFK